MAGLTAATVLSTTASLVSATHSGFELTTKLPPLFPRTTSTHDHLNHASAYNEMSLERMEKYQNALPHRAVHQWKVRHNSNLAALSNLQAQLDKFDGIGIVKKTFSVTLRKQRRILDSWAFDLAKECKATWDATKVLTDSVRSHIVSQIARENGVLSMDFLAVTSCMSGPNTSTSDPSTPTQMKSRFTQNPCVAPNPFQDRMDSFVSTEYYSMIDLQSASGASDETPSIYSQTTALVDGRFETRELT